LSGGCVDGGAGRSGSNGQAGGSAAVADSHRTRPGFITSGILSGKLELGTSGERDDPFYAGRGAVEVAEVVEDLATRVTGVDSDEVNVSLACLPGNGGGFALGEGRGVDSEVLGDNGGESGGADEREGKE